MGYSPWGHKESDTTNTHTHRGDGGPCPQSLSAERFWIPVPDQARPWGKSSPDCVHSQTQCVTEELSLRPFLSGSPLAAPHQVQHMHPDLETQGCKLSALSSCRGKAAE